jgi:hypothetical protein
VDEEKVKNRTRLLYLGSSQSHSQFSRFGLCVKKLIKNLIYANISSLRFLRVSSLFLQSLQQSCLFTILVLDVCP